MKKARLALVVVLTLMLAQLTLADTPQPAPFELGARLPDAITHATTEPMRCLTAEAHFDPCAVQTLRGVRYVLAWDQDTFQLVYLFTDDAAFRSQSNLAVGGQLRLVRSRLLSFKNWQIDPRSVSAGWFPVVAPLDQPSLVGQEDETNALIIGFVRTVYLNERVLTR